MAKEINKLSVFDISDFNNLLIKKYLVFLSVAIFWVTLTPAFAARDAVVSRDRAIIYADLDKQSPIGFVRKGRVVRVGEVPRNRATMLPVALSNGSVGYIEIDDITIAKKEEVYDKLPSRVRKVERNFEGLGGIFLKRKSYFRTDGEDFLFENQFDTYGLEIKGGLVYKKFWQIRLGTELESTVLENYTYRFMTTYLEVGANLIRFRKGALGIFGQAGLYPFASSKTDLAKIRGTGHFLAVKGELTYQFKRHVVLSFIAGASQVRLSQFREGVIDNRSADFNAVDFGVGLTYTSDFIN